MIGLLVEETTIQEWKEVLEEATVLTQEGAEVVIYLGIL